MRRVALVGLPGSGVRTLAARLDLACRFGDEHWHPLSFLVGPRPGEELGPWIDEASPEAAIVVVSCLQGVNAQVKDSFDALVERGLPVLVVLTSIDAPGVDTDQVSGIVEHVLGDGAAISIDHRVILDDHEHPIGFISLIDGGIIEWSDGLPAYVEPDPEHLDLIEDESEALVESIVLSASDDELFGAWNTGKDLDASDIGAEYAAQARAGMRHPLLYAGVSPRGLGDALVLDLLAAMLET